MLLTTPPDWLLNPSRIDLFHFPLHTLFENADTLLDADETLRAHRFLFPKHQRRFTVARATLRLILAQYLFLAPQELHFTYNAHGKPNVLSSTDLQFNVSHSEEWAILAVGQTHPLGVDLEFFSDRPYSGIATHLFSDSEQRILQNAPLSLQPLIFFHIWAQKEAFIKATGLGLAYPAQQISVTVFPKAPIQVIDPLKQMSWQLRPFMPHIACCGALCCHLSITEVRTFVLSNLPILS